MFEINSLSVGYGQARVVNSVSLTVQPGETVGILGRNGVGKTTLLRGLFGLSDVLEGSVTFNGAPVSFGRPEFFGKRGVTFMPDDRGVFPELTIEENLRLATRKDYTPVVDVTDVFPLLSERPKALAGVLSGGQKQQVGLARAILAGSEYIFIDELSQGLSPTVVGDVTAALRAVAASGVGIVLVEQTPAIALDVCERIAVMLKGEFALETTRAEIESNPSLIEELLTVS